MTGASHAAETGKTPWDMRTLAAVPKVYEDREHSTEDVKALFYEGLPWKGKPTRVFAYYGVPRTEAGKTNHKHPAMVLVHGGGGSAFIPWVRLWVSRGYAAIAMDTCGSVSSGGYNNHPRHENGGPPGWGGFDQIDAPIQDQWTYHAVADVILAHSLIRSFPEVDAKRVGLTGISWGGYLTCIVAGVDSRFKFAAPVYGCGFLGDNSVWLPDFKALGTEKAQKWLGLWDPSVYLSQAQMPMLWVTGTNDFAYPMDSLQRSYRLPKPARTLCLRVAMPHGHGGPGENPEEIHAMADALLQHGPSLPHVMKQGHTSQGASQEAWAICDTHTPIQSLKADLNYTADTGPWQKRQWKTISADLDPKTGRASLSLPAGTTVYYFNFTFDLANLHNPIHNLIVSSEHEAL